MSKLIDKFREENKGISPKKLVDTYFNMLRKIEEYRRKKRFDKMLVYCQMSLPLLEPLIVETKKEYGTFDINSIPAIELGSIFWAIYGLEEQLINLKEIVEYFPELHPWREIIEEAFIMKDLAFKICQYVRDNEGVLQINLKKALGVKNGRMVSRVVHYMELAGKMKRKKIGNTYALFCNF